MKRFIKAAPIIVLGTVTLSVLGAIILYDRKTQKPLDLVINFALLLPAVGSVMLHNYNYVFIKPDEETSEKGGY